MSKYFFRIAFFGLLFLSPALAERIDVGQDLSDGNHGRVFSKWVEFIPDRSVHKIRAQLEKLSGGEDTFVSLRFGDQGAFDAGKRVYLGARSNLIAEWSLGDEKPGGRPLELTGHNGIIFLDWVEIVYSGATQQDSWTIEPNTAEGVWDTPATESRRQSRFDRSSSERAERHCRYQRVRQPRFDVGRIVATGELLSTDYTIEGSLYGACIREAGYFEHGQLAETFEFPFSESYHRQPFKAKVRGGVNGQFRAHTTDGQIEVINVDLLLLRRYGVR